MSIPSLSPRSLRILAPALVAVLVTIGVAIIGRGKHPDAPTVAPTPDVAASEATRSTPSGGSEPANLAVQAPAQTDPAPEPVGEGGVVPAPVASIDGAIDPPIDPQLDEVRGRIRQLEASMATLEERQRVLEAAVAQQQARPVEGAIPTETPGPSPEPGDPAASDAVADSAGTPSEAPSAVAGPAPAGPDRSGLDEALARLAVRVDERGPVLALRASQLGFPVGKAELPPEASTLLEPIAALLERYPHLRVRIEGHTDRKGIDARNLALSQARADAVRARLTGLGVDPGRIETIGFGGSRPITDNRTAGARERNRRIEILFLEQ